MEQLYKGQSPEDLEVLEAVRFRGVYMVLERAKEAQARALATLRFLAPWAVLSAVFRTKERLLVALDWALPSTLLPLLLSEG